MAAESGEAGSSTDPTVIDRAAALFGRAREAVETIVRGKPHVVELALVAVAAGGHVLVEDVPGVGAEDHCVGAIHPHGHAHNHAQEKKRR